MERPQHGNQISHIVEHVAVDPSSKNHHGLGLWPPWSKDERDPLRWPQYVKVLALLSTALYNFTANIAAAGLSPAIILLEMQFHKSQSDITSLLTYNFLLLGIGNMFWVPISVKYGKRATLLTSMAMLLIILIWTAKVDTYSRFLVARCISGLASAGGESILPGIVSDMFFLHERSAMMSIYGILISSGSAVGPLIAGFMIQSSPGTWRDFVWLCVGLTGFNLVAIFLFYPESSFVRPPIEDIPPSSLQVDSGIAKEEGNGTSYTVEHHPRPANDITPTLTTVSIVPVSYPRVWKTFIRVNPHVNILKVFMGPFIFLLSTPVLWTMFLYGSALAASIILTYALPGLLIPPPYNFEASRVGLMQVAAVIGFVVGGCGGGYICDVITAKLIIRNRGIFVPEQRLISLIPGCLIGPAGCILIAFACDQKLHWASIAVGMGMLAFSVAFGPNVALSYLLDCYPAFAQEILVAVNVAKNLVAFLFLFVAINWVQSQGWIQVYMIMFMVVSLSYLLAVPLYFYGKKSREASDKIISNLVGTS